jgi:hypothetical protein
MKRLIISLTLGMIVAVLTCFSGLSAFAEIPHLINYQGMLTDNSGNPLTGYYNLTIKIWTDTTGGSSLWTETQNGVQVTKGLFGVILGKQTVLNLAFDQQYWLEVGVGTETMPRIRFTSVGYAYRAAMADSASVAGSAPTGGGWTDDGAVVRLTTGTDSVGIGTASPGCALHVLNSSSYYGMLRIQNSNTGNNEASMGFIGGSEVDHEAWLVGTGAWIAGRNFVIGRDGAMLIITAADGNVGIGTYDPAGYKLAVLGSAIKTGSSSWDVYSDLRLKEIKAPYEYGLTEINKLDPVHYGYKESNALGLPSDGDFVGLVAQDVQEVIPDAVKRDDNGYLTLNNDPIIWAMLNAIKELKAENDQLKKRIEALEER